MRRQINMHDAKTHLSRLIQEAAEGQEIVIAKAGKPLARLVAYRPPESIRKPGIWRGRVQFDTDFDTLPPELEAAFRGEAD